MKNVLTSLLNPPTKGPTSTLLLRLMAGGVFLWEGVLKFVYANQGVGRFTKLGMPFPHMTACGGWTTPSIDSRVGRLTTRMDLPY